MRTAPGLALIAIGAIFAFAVTGSPSWINLQIAGWVLILTGVAAILIPRRGYGWLRRRVVVRRPRGPAGRAARSAPAGGSAGPPAPCAPRKNCRRRMPPAVGPFPARPSRPRRRSRSTSRNEPRLAGRRESPGNGARLGAIGVRRVVVTTRVLSREPRRGHGSPAC